MKMMKMNEKNYRAEDQGIRICDDPQVSLVLQAECIAWNEPNLAGSVQKYFSDPHPVEIINASAA